MSDFAFKQTPRARLDLIDTWTKEAHRDPAGFTPASHKLLKTERTKALSNLQEDQIKNFDRSK